MIYKDNIITLKNTNKVSWGGEIRTKIIIFEKNYSEIKNTQQVLRYQNFAHKQ